MTDDHPPMPMPMQKHDWKTDANGHIWGRWMSKTRTTEYRQCVHPSCHEVQERLVSSA